LVELAGQPGGMAEAVRFVELRRDCEDLRGEVLLALGQYANLLGDLEAAVAVEP
jgi:hypothetical protein